jgi:hypothetical protein
MSPVLQDADIPGTSPGPDASLPFGGAQQMQQLAGELGQQQQGPGAPPPPGQQAPARPGAAPPVAPAQPPPQAPAMPVQDQNSRLDLTGQFSPLRMGPTLPWRQRLRVWAAHPRAGPYLGALAGIVDQQRGPAEPDAGQ